MFAPETLWAPQALPFSSTATGISPSFSVSSGSSESSCITLFAHASPAGPPPTITIPASRRSSSGSVGGPTKSAGSNGGGYSPGATAMLGSAALLRLDGFGQLGHDLVQIAHDPEVAELEDRRVLILVDRDDVLGVLHADLVLDRAGDAGGEIELRRHRLAGLADLRRVRRPAGIDDRAGRSDGATERFGELVCDGEIVRISESTARADQEVGVLDVHPALVAGLAARLHTRLRRPFRELDL